MFELPDKGIIKARIHFCSNGAVAQAHYENCDGAFFYVTFAISGTDFIITSVGRHSRATDDEARLGGDAIDSLLALEAAKRGVTKLFIIHPGDKVEWVRTYEPCITALTQLPATNRPIYLN
jgi:hypothetical protein